MYQVIFQTCHLKHLLVVPGRPKQVILAVAKITLFSGLFRWSLAQVPCHQQTLHLLIRKLIYMHIISKPYNMSCMNVQMYKTNYIYGVQKCLVQIFYSGRLGRAIAPVCAQIQGSVNLNNMKNGGFGRLYSFQDDISLESNNIQSRLLCFPS